MALNPRKYPVNCKNNHADTFGIQTIKAMSEKGLSGGIIYDALIAKAALKAKADRLLTLNKKDFEKIVPGNEIILYSP